MDNKSLDHAYKIPTYSHYLQIFLQYMMHNTLKHNYVYTITKALTVSPPISISLQSILYISHYYIFIYLIIILFVIQSITDHIKSVTSALLHLKIVSVMIHLKKKICQHQSLWSYRD